MRLCIVGGRLQGIEAVYLAEKAGYEALVVDKDPGAPALALAEESLVLDVTKTGMNDIMDDVDFILPTTENHETLNYLSKALASPEGSQFLYDPRAHSVTSSKVRSNRFFERLGIPIPGRSFPLIIKPSQSSGSEGVRLVENECELEKAYKGIDGKVVAQEYIEGPSLSLEVVGDGKRYFPLLETELEFDELYDCKRVRYPIAPTSAAASSIEELKSWSVEIARGLNLRGVTDVEVMVRDGKLYFLEIDARLPSQTPTAVLKASGCNILAELVMSFDDRLSGKKIKPSKAVIYEHIFVTDNSLKVCGEHVMAGARGLGLSEDFFGANEAITNFYEVEGDWVATLILTSGTWDEVSKLHEKVIEKIMDECSIESYIDLSPDYHDQINL